MKHIYTTTYRGRQVFIGTIGGHIGYLRQAIARTPGVSEYRKSSFNGHAGVNTSLTVEFERDDEALYELLLDNYRAICEEQTRQRQQRRIAEPLQ